MKPAQNAADGDHANWTAGDDRSGLRDWASVLATSALIVVAFFIVDDWMMTSGLEKHLEAGRSAIWLGSLLTGLAVSYRLSKPKPSR